MQGIPFYGSYLTYNRHPACHGKRVGMSLATLEMQTGMPDIQLCLYFTDFKQTFDLSGRLDQILQKVQIIQTSTNSTQTYT